MSFAQMRPITRIQTRRVHARACLAMAIRAAMSLGIVIGTSAPAAEQSAQAVSVAASGSQSLPRSAKPAAVPSRSAPSAAPVSTGSSVPPSPQRDSPSDKRAPEQATPAAPPGDQDPLDRLQQRLSERLGSRMAKSEETAEGDLRVVARPASAEKSKGTAAKATGARHAALGAGKAADALVLGDWTYEGPAGPERWAQLKPEYAACGQGKRQSPIDVRGGIKVQLEPVLFDYQKPGFSVIDNGRTVRVHVAPGNFIEVMGRRYELTHAQFHKPSEVRIEGRVFDMSIHLIHRDAQGRQALIAVMLERGDAHPAIQSVLNNLPLEKGVDLPARVPLDLMSLLPADQRYATFMGSMTTPPCQEGVLWMVMKTPISVSEHQLAVFSHLYPMNARPVQPSHGRLIKESE